MRNEIENFKDCKSIAIMGGTFDPIHNGHLVTAEAVRHRFNVDKVIFMPAGRPAHKANKKITHNRRGVGILPKKNLFGAFNICYYNSNKDLTALHCERAAGS